MKILSEEPLEFGLKVLDETPIKERKSLDVKRALLTAANGAALGAFPEVAGQVKGQMRGMRDFAKSMMLDHRLINTRSDAARELNRNEYLKTKKNIQHDIDEYAKEHPTMSMIADMAGSIPTAVLIPGGSAVRGAKLLSTMGKAARAGAIYGGSRGFGESVNADDNLEDIIKSSLKGAAVGGAIGGAAGGILSPFTKSKLASLEKAIGKNRIEESIKKGIPLLEDGGERVMQVARSIKTKGNPKALQRFVNFEKKLEGVQKNKINKIIEENLSDKNYNDMLMKIQKEGESIYNPLYAEAMKAGEIARPRTQNSNVLKDYFKKARKFSDDLKGLPDNDIRVLQRVKEKLGDDIAKYEKFGEKSTARDLETLNKNLVQDIDDSVFLHGKAREAFAKTKRKEEVMHRGFKDIPKSSLEEIEAMSPIDLPKGEQSELLKAGAAQYFKNKAFNAPKTNANIFRNVFADDELVRLVKAKIMSPEGTKKIRDAVYSADKSIDNIHSLTSGSQTAEKLMQAQDNNPLRWITSTKKKGIQLSDKIWDKIIGSGDGRTAKYLTDSKALKSAVKREGIKRPVTKDDILYKLLGGQNGRKKKEYYK
ncbi:hypothetical protein [Candidatus Endomicrobiellum devescovinae]|uniref:hypothetical protein n=1 Tax=Candidatus Endomicrobiellum devescovinae TaxID=3242322 RepID=UPI002827A013|nr:hypothetical protein [Endomicrobium sp.]